MKNQTCFSAVIILATVTILAACTNKIAEPPRTGQQRISPEKQTAVETQQKNVIASVYHPAQWSDLRGWFDDDLYPAWQAFLQSCTKLKQQSLWQETCSAATTLQTTDNTRLRAFFERHFSLYQVIGSDGNDKGLVTGYYEPLLHGSRKPSNRYRYPLYSAPDELLTIDLGTLYPELKDLRLRGRLDGGKIVPYYSRAEIMRNPALLNGHELFWVDDEVELFFLQIQGSGRIQLDTGEIIKVGFANQNGYPYQSIGQILVKQGELPLERASMQGIKQWGKQNPEKLPALLQQNARFVFFRELPGELSGPIGALGVPLTAGRSIAIDPRSIPQGAPVFLETTWPNTNKPLNRLMIAQDTGNAIKGSLRSDFFWGYGQEAANQAGKMKQSGKMWILMPNGYNVTQFMQQ